VTFTEPERTGGRLLWLSRITAQSIWVMFRRPPPLPARR
jgi:hypothetical protein